LIEQCDFLYIQQLIGIIQTRTSSGKRDMSGITGIIGTGRMGAALARGLVQSGTRPDDMLLFDSDTEAVERAVLDTGAPAASSISDLASGADVIVLAVKPQNMDAVLAEISNAGGKLVVSIAAGITTTRIEEALGKETRVVRVMPNTPLQINMGASAYCLGSTASKEDGDLAGEMFGRFGVALEVTEDLMDVVTGLSGSGPAFIYYMIESLVEGAIQEGLQRDTALKLAAQTALGAAAMVLKTGKNPSDLRDEVTSPGGTTLAGLAALKNKDWAAITASAVAAATERSKELGRSVGNP
jgi:pyrroline-5-carboxylate reductase